ncbi:class D sortase [Acanthopleuribacter pedis]|uniref:Class D sortase n=1 Tax=Acanthopleuribacter pedis TaxID=442870 RepID=A0A8J7Q920_9BACT|nr:class D sortase [Acanthopleuribacter pedis]MBO1319962.1 class D sortase [Acanthopleuribacter pedis]
MKSATADTAAPIAATTRLLGELLTSRRLPLGLLFAALLIAVRPVYHLTLRVVSQWQAERLWRDRPQNSQLVFSGDPIAWLSHRESGLDTLVLLDGNQENLNRFPCWSMAGSMPDRRGLKIILGHRDAHFRELGLMSQGETVQLKTQQGGQTFVVDQIEIVEKEQLGDHLIMSQDRDAVVLVTCYPFTYTGSAPHRYLVWLRPQKEPLV